MQLNLPLLTLLSLYLQFAQTSIVRSASILPITPPPAAPQSIIYRFKPPMDEPDSFHSPQLGSLSPYSTQITETSIASSVDLKGNLAVSLIMDLLC